MTEMHIHDEIEDWSAAALCDALTPDEQKNLELHLTECPQCRSLCEENKKMNDILDDTMPALRPDPNFERRVITGFREKTAGGWTRRLRNLNGLAWFMQFRPVQAAFAVLILAAMVKCGSLLTGERFPAGPNFAGVASNPTAFNALADVADASFWKPYTDEELKPGVPPAHQNSYGITRTGAGKLTLNGGNTYTGATTITNGTLSLGDSTTSANNRHYATGSRPQTKDLNSWAEPLPAAGYDKDTSSYQIYADTAQPVGGPEPLFSPPQVAQSQQITTGLRSGSQAISANAIDQLLGLNENSTDATHQEKSPALQAKNPPAAVDDSRKLIRNANLEIEVEHFDKALETIATVAGEEQGYVATQNSVRGENGKLRGSIVVKVLPANLDRFLLKLRALGDLKNQTLATEDVTKSYFDTEARLRNSKRMEDRLLEMLQKNTGKVSDLLQVEKELARVRESIEQMQGQLKYYDTLVSYATVTISLGEKDLSQPAAYRLREHATLSLFAKDVEKAFAEAKGDAESAKAQTVESHIERDGEGRVTATLHLLIAPDVSDATVAKLKAIGRIQNFSSETQRIANSGSRDGSGNTDAAKIERDKVELNLTIQRDEEPAAQQTSLSVLTDRVEEKTAQLKQAAATAGIEIKNAVFNRAPNGSEVSNLVLRLPVRKYGPFLEQVKSLGKVKDFTVTRRDDAASENAPAEISLQIYSQADIVTDDTGVLATIRKTLGQAFTGLMWSVRMIGVSLAFVAPWGAALGLVAWIVVRRRRRS